MTLLATVLGCGCALGVSPVIEELIVPQDQGVFFDDAGGPADDLGGLDGTVSSDATPTDDLGATGDRGPADVPCNSDNGGACNPGAVQSCGACGMQMCNAACGWSACVGGGACTPGAHQACGNCGSQTCTETCTWSACAGEGVCAPNATRSDHCGNCGTQQYRCSMACAWVAQGACSGQGVCAPNSTQGGGCDGCSEQVCGTNCAWSGCRLRPGNACEWQGGGNHRSCSQCACGLQWCLNSCQWSSSCVSCCSSCGGCQ